MPEPVAKILPWMAQKLSGPLARPEIPPALCKSLLNESRFFACITQNPVRFYPIQPPIISKQITKFFIKINFAPPYSEETLIVGMASYKKRHGGPNAMKSYLAASFEDFSQCPPTL